MIKKENTDSGKKRLNKSPVLLNLSWKYQSEFRLEGHPCKEERKKKKKKRLTVENEGRLTVPNRRVQEDDS